MNVRRYDLIAPSKFNRMLIILKLMYPYCYLNAKSAPYEEVLSTIMTSSLHRQKSSPHYMSNHHFNNFGTSTIR